MAAKRYCMPDPTAVLTDQIITDQIDAGSRVIDLGCGDGHLLRHLRDQHECSILGVELNMDRMHAAIGLGVPVLHADLDAGLEEIPDDAFDVAILSQTLQQVRHPNAVLLEMLRISQRALVVVPNFGNWKVRRQVVLYGRAPVTEALPYEWYNTPNLHFMSIHDFRDLVGRLNIRIVKELQIIGNRAVDHAWAANLRADSVLYVLERTQS